MTLSEKICDLRKQQHWSQEELAEKLDISRQSVSKWESGSSVPDLNKIIKLSDLFGVSTDYLLKDDYIEQDDRNDTFLPTEVKEETRETPLPVLSKEDTMEYIEAIGKTAKWISLGISLCIISAAVFLGICSFIPSEESSAFSQIKEQTIGSIGLAALLVIVAIGVALLIFNGFRLSSYEYLEKDSFELENGLYEVINEKKEEFAPVFRKCITVGVVLCIIGVVPLFLASALNVREQVYIWCTSLLLFFVAFATFLFVWSGMYHSCFEKLLQVGDYSLENKKVTDHIKDFPGIYWCFITAIYLGVSFFFDNWNQSWIIWPVAGVLFAAIFQFLKFRIKTKFH